MPPTALRRSSPSRTRRRRSGRPLQSTQRPSRASTDVGLRAVFTSGAPTGECLDRANVPDPAILSASLTPPCRFSGRSKVHLRRGTMKEPAMLMTSLQRGQAGGVLTFGLPLDVAPLLRVPEQLPALRPAEPAPSRRQRLFRAASGRLTLDHAADRSTGVLCVHFSADGREHGMWFVGPEDDEGPTSPPPRLPSG